MKEARVIAKQEGETIKESRPPGKQSGLTIKDFVVLGR
jgi:hypothetical protein